LYNGIDVVGLESQYVTVCDEGDCDGSRSLSHCARDCKWKRFSSIELSAFYDWSFVPSISTKGNKTIIILS